MGGTGLGLCLAVCLAAPPAPPAGRPAERDATLAREAQLLATWLTDLADRVSAKHPAEVPAHKLLVAGLAVLYEKYGEKLPDRLAQQLADAGPGERTHLVAEARVALGRRDGLTPLQAFVVAADGFARAADPYCGLTWQRTLSFASSDAEYGLGFELEGATGGRWVAYMLENAVGNGSAWLDEAAAPRPPVGVPWVVRRVIPGSPAAKAGLRPGDAVTHFEGTELTARSNDEQYRRLVSVAVPVGAPPRPGAPIDLGKPIHLRVRRAGVAEPVELSLSRAGYEPECVYGVTRRDDGAWDFMLDRDARIGYVRLGAVEESASVAFEHAVGELIQDHAAGLVLDLRWCPGGYVTPTVKIAGCLLPAGKVVTAMRYPHPSAGQPGAYSSGGPPGGEAWLKLPVAVLVNGETTGGGEMLAAALQDHGRAVVVGQRTFGKANIMNLLDTPFPGVGFRVSTGYSIRPNGKNRHRRPDSKPTDDWGVRPDPGYEVPLTPDLNAKLRRQAELHAIRPAGSSEAVPFDDPLADPQKLVAVKLLKERIKAADTKRPK